MKLITTRLAATLLAGLTGAALAAVTAEEAKMLAGPPHTPWGALVAGNKEGTIPAWTRGLSSRRPATTRRTRACGPIRSRARSRCSRSTRSLGRTQQAQRGRQGDAEEVPHLPHRRLPVAPHRELPAVRDREHEEERNRRVQDDKNGLGIEGCYAGLPFPFPKNGSEVMWNRLLKYDTTALCSAHGGRVVDTQG